MCYTRPLVIVHFRIGVGWFREKGRGLLRKDEVRNSRKDSKRALGKARKGFRLSSTLSGTEGQTWEWPQKMLKEGRGLPKSGPRTSERGSKWMLVRGLDNRGGNSYQQQQGLNAGRRPRRRDAGGADNKPTCRFGLKARRRHALQCRHAAWYSRTNLVTTHKIGRMRLEITVGGH
jgi:hypothetical protein